MHHCPLKCVNNLSKKSGNDTVYLHSVKDKNRIFTGYQNNFHHWSNPGISSVSI